MLRRGPRFVHFGLALLATATAVTGVALTGRASAPDDAREGAVGLLVYAIVFGWAGAFLMGFPKARYLARILLAAGVAAGLGAAALGVGPSLAGAPRQAMEFLAFVGVSGTLLLTLALLPQAFPDGPQQAWRWPLIFRVTLWSIIAIALMLGSLVGLESIAPGSVAPFATVVWSLFLLGMIGGTVLGTASLAARFDRAAAAQKGQLKVYVVVNVGFIFAAVLIPTGLFGGLLLLLWPVVVVTVIGLSVLRAQLYDIRVVVKRAAIDAALGTLVAALFVAVYFASLFLISEGLDQFEYRWAAVAVAVVGVVLVEPVRRRIRQALERRLLGERSDPLAALDRLQETISQSDEATLYSGVVGTVAAAVRSPHVALVVHRDAATDAVAAIGDPAGEPYVAPLVYLGERLGELQVSPRTVGEAFGAADQRLLDQLARQTAALVYSKRRDSELAGARRETVDVIVEERSRLGRDLHDGLAPLLAGAGLSAEALRRSFPRGSPDEEEAARLAALLRRTASDTRRMAHDLQPPEPPADLEKAIEDYLAGLNGPEFPAFTVTIDVGDLPAAVGQAAYLVLLEATTNVVRHAQATSATLSATLQADRLQLEVVDDGVGLEQPYVSGVGISSMRRRVESLGGTFHLGRQPSGGTHLSASMPLTPDRATASTEDQTQRKPR